MSSSVSEEYWCSYLGDMPMPEDATMEMFWAARGALDSMEYLEETLDNIKTFERIESFYQNKGEKSIDGLKWAREILDFYRGELNGS